MVHCSICLEIRTNPCCCVPCGHIFCRDCIESWSKRTKECPDCRRQIDRLQSIFGLEDSKHNNDETDTKAKGDQSFFLQQHRIALQKQWVLLIIGIVIVVGLVIDLSSSDSWSYHIIQKATTIPGAILNLLVLVITFLCKLLMFPFQFLYNINSLFDTFSSFVNHMFWIIIYIFLFVFIVWYCVHTVSITKDRIERKKKRR